MTQIRKVTERDKFEALHFELDFGNELIVTTNNRIRASRSLSLSQQKTPAAAAPGEVVGRGTYK